MASPLTEMAEASLNRATPRPTKYEHYEVRTFSSQETNMPGDGDSTQRSSPLVSTVNNGAVVPDQENASPSKAARHSRVLSGTELSPLRILAEQQSSPSEGAPRSPRRGCPEKRFPVKVSGPEETPRVVRTHQQPMSLEEAVRANEGLKHAIEIFEDEQSALEEAGEVEAETEDARRDATATVKANAGQADGDGPDDTMVSTFSTLSTFSAIPNMTMFARLGQSPAKFSGLGISPRARRDEASPSRTGAEPGSSSNTTNLLMDFTEQLRFPHQKSPAKRASHASSASRISAAAAATPSRQQLSASSLIDLEMPPMPTPRSVPSITAREFESLKSGFLSEISSLKASLSGKQAEVQSLKAAVGDAEKRVGESLEQLREERALREQLAAERQGWETRGREVEGVLRKAREEIVAGERQRDELERRLEESDKRREAAEMLHQEAESKMAGMRAGKDVEASGKPASPSLDSSSSSGSSSSKAARREVEAAVERVARELHALYKSKHDTKVAALKKSYEARWEARVRGLEARVAEPAGDNERLRRDGGAGPAPAPAPADAAAAEERRAQAARDGVAIVSLNADVQRLEAVVRTVTADNGELRRLLERERVEKGELVQLAEEMMSMQSFVVAQPQPRPDAAKTPRSGPAAARASGLRAPASGLRAPHERTRSGGGGGGGGGGVPRPGGVPVRSGIMSSIERMGNYRGRGD